MAEQEYIIQPGDTFYLLSKRWGGTCDDWVRVNPRLNPDTLQVGQRITLPALSGGRDQYVEVSLAQGREFSGEHMDEIEMELEGVQFKLRRVGESRIPHEIHFILPRAEIRKIQPQGEHGPTEVQIMLSNVDIVHSPRLMSDRADKAETGKRGTTASEDSSKTGSSMGAGTMTPGAAGGASPGAGQGFGPGSGQGFGQGASQGFGPGSGPGLGQGFGQGYGQ